MRPWPFDHGNILDCHKYPCDTEASMRPWPFDHGNAAGGITTRDIASGFNEAMTFRSWKSITAIVGQRMYPELQWGHDLSIMEISESNFTTVQAASASMRPWPFDHGNWVETEPWFSYRRASMRPWPFDHGNIGAGLTCIKFPFASMRPWPFDHGNLN